MISALRPLTPADTVRGQYDGYREVSGVDPRSTTESYVAVRLAMDSWRWAGVPILIRAGKTMPVTATEVSIRFHRPPNDLFGVNDPEMTNALRFRIWPETRMTLDLAGKKPGAGRIPQLQALSFAEEPGSDMRPYDRLIGAALDGNRLPFARQDAVEAAWKVVDPILDDVVPVHSLSARQLGAEGGRRPAARRAPLARPGRLIDLGGGVPREPRLILSR